MARRQAKPAEATKPSVQALHLRTGASLERWINPSGFSLEYPGHFLVKRVTNAGTFRFQDRLLFIANALKTHHIGLEETDDGIWSIYLGTVLLAKVDEREMVIRD